MKNKGKAVQLFLAVTWTAIWAVDLWELTKSVSIGENPMLVFLLLIFTLAVLAHWYRWFTYDKKHPKDPEA